MGEDVIVEENKMGFIACTSYVVGNIIGSGIFITPGTIVGYVNSVGLSLVVWVICGIISLWGGICFIELGTSILEPGCDFAYAVYVGWEGLAFAFMWVSVLMTYPASAAVQAQTFGQYIVTGLAPVWPLDHVWGDVVSRALGYSLLILLGVMNLFSLSKVAAKFQVISTIAKMGSMAVIIITGFYYLIFEGWTQNFVDSFAGSNWNPGTLSLALYGGLWSYTGWDILNYGTPEIKNPRRTMPLSLVSGVLVVAATYLCINTAYFVALSPQEMVNSTAVAADFAQKTLGSFSYAIPFMVALLFVGTINSNLFCGSRFMHAAARQGHLPAFLSCINEKSGSPRASVIGQIILVIVVSFVDINTLINYVTFVIWGQKAVSMAALLYLRHKKMQVADGAIRLPIIVSVLFLFICITLVLVPFIEEPLQTGVGVLFVASGLIFYLLLVRPTSVPKPLAAINDSLSRITCRILACQLDLQKGGVADAQRSDELESLDPPKARATSPSYTEAPSETAGLTDRL